MSYVNSILKAVNQQLSEMATNMDTPGWITLALITVVAGFLFLRGNTLRSS